MISICVLAGGSSSRMGTDKGLVPINGLPMIQYILNQARILTSDIKIISSNKDYDQFDYERLEDQTPNRGPVEGILTGLRNANKDRVMFLSCDMPLLGVFELDRLLNANQKELVCYEDEFCFPFPGIYSRHLIQRWEELLNQGERRMETLIKSFDYEALVVDNRSLFLNVNEMSDLEKASAYLYEY